MWSSWREARSVGWNWSQVIAGNERRWHQERVGWRYQQGLILEGWVAVDNRWIESGKRKVIDHEFYTI